MRVPVRARSLLGAAAFAGLLGAAVAWKGVFLSRDWLFAWVALAVVALSAGQARRRLPRAAKDWLPVLALLLAYDLSGAVRELLGTTPHVLPQLLADRALPGGEIPTIALQRALYVPGEAQWYDLAAFALYLSHFFVTLAVAVVLWRFAHHRFGRFRALVAALATAGFATYVLFPAVPPWLAAQSGHIAPVHRTVGHMWDHVGVHPAAALFETRAAFYNEVGALPSLHAAYPLLLALFFWRDGRWVRAGLLGYAVAMGLTLVYTGEHYVSDILVGWAYAGGVFALVSRVRLPRPRRARAARPEYEAAAAGWWPEAEVRLQLPEWLGVPDDARGMSLVAERERTRAGDSRGWRQARPDAGKWRRTDDSGH